MFTGIIQELGTVASLRRRTGIVELAVAAPKTAARLQPMESVAVNGACLTVVGIHRGTMRFEAIPETLRMTALGALRVGHRVNLEPSLSLADRLNGHFVFGHVDGVGTVAKRAQAAGELVLTIRVPAALRRYLVPKGPVALEGVSLTVGAHLTRSTFAVHLIPETLRQTTLAWCQEGQQLNVEVDYLAKLVRQFLGKR